MSRTEVYNTKRYEANNSQICGYIPSKRKRERKVTGHVTPITNANGKITGKTETTRIKTVTIGM